MEPRSIRPIQKAPAVLLVGPKFSGKSLLVEGIATRMSREGLRPAGFVQRGVFDGSGGKIGYDLVRLTDGEERPLARLSDGGKGWTFFDEVFDFAARSIKSDADACFIDEIGPVELRGKGHRDTLSRALENQSLIMIVVREELADAVGEMIGPDRPITKISHCGQRARENEDLIIDLIGKSVDRRSPRG